MAMKAWTIRPLHDTDAASILMLAKTLGKWFNEEGLAHMSRDLTSHGGFVAVRGERLLGFITWAPLGGELANLSWMGVAENLRRSGIGRALLAALVSHLRSCGYRTLEVSTVADSMDYAPYADTRAFYRAMGFVDHRIDKDYFRSADGPYDRLLLRLDLGHRGPPMGVSEN